MYDSSSGRAVRSSLESIARNGGEPSAESRGELRERVFAAVDELTMLGWPIERIIVRMKELTAEVGLPSRAMSWEPRHDTVVGDVVRWCIERHFRTKGDGDGGPHKRGA